MTSSNNDDAARAQKVREKAGKAAVKAREKAEKAAKKAEKKAEKAVEKAVEKAKAAQDASSKAADPRSLRTENQILTAFDALLEEKELSEITVTDLTKQAGISRKTFYLHYNSIDDLVQALILSEMEKAAESLGAVSVNNNGAINVEELLVALGEELIASANRRAHVVKSVSTDWLLDHLKPLLTSVLIEKDSLGLAEKLGSYLDIFVAFFCAGILSAYHQWASSESELPMETVSVLISASIAGGVAALTEKAASLGINRS